jgi:hypothetical protein
MRAVLRADATVGVSAGQVWDVLVDWPRQSDWIPLTRVRTVAGDSRGVGGRIEAWTGVGRTGFRDPMIITSWEPPRRCEVLHTGLVVRGEAGFEVTPAGPDVAKVAWWESVEVPLGRVGLAGWRLSAPAWRYVLGRSLRRLGEIAEADAAP